MPRNLGEASNPRSSKYRSSAWMVPENLVTGLRTVLPILTTPTVSPETIGISVVADRPSGLSSMLAIDRALIESTSISSSRDVAFLSFAWSPCTHGSAPDGVWVCTSTARSASGRSVLASDAQSAAWGPGRNAAGDAARLAATHSGVLRYAAALRVIPNPALWRSARIKSTTAVSMLNGLPMVNAVPAM